MKFRRAFVNVVAASPQKFGIVAPILKLAVFVAIHLLEYLDTGINRNVLALCTLIGVVDGE